MTETTNYHLSQWAKDDRIRMDDFNADNAKIDAALATIPRFHTGSYTGTGTHVDNPMSLTFPFPPKLVLILAEQDASLADLDCFGAVFLAGMTECGGIGCSNVYGGLYLKLTWSGNKVSWTTSVRNQRRPSVLLDMAGVKYLYLGIG